MEELKLHANGANKHLEAIKVTFEALKKGLKNDTSLSDTEKRNQLAKAKVAYLEENKSLKNKLF
jgi:hypothetical protein